MSRAAVLAALKSIWKYTR